MINSRITVSVVALVTAMALGAFPAAAQINITASTSVSGTVSTGAVSTQKLSAVLSRSDTEITARIADMNKLNTRIQAMKNVSDAEKASISSQVQTNISGLTALQTKINTDTDLKIARTDEASIFGSFRIYALIIPRGYIVASADRISTISNLMTGISAKIQARITADQTAGRTVTALVTTLADVHAKIADASTQSQTAQSGVVSLNPDQGNKATLQSNQTALAAARANIKTGTQDLQVARQEIKTILQGLKVLNTKTSVSASSTTATQ